MSHYYLISDPFIYIKPSIATPVGMQSYYTKNITWDLIKHFTNGVNLFCASVVKMFFHVFIIQKQYTICMENKVYLVASFCIDDLPLKVMYLAPRIDFFVGEIFVPIKECEQLIGTSCFPCAGHSCQYISLTMKPFQNFWHFCIVLYLLVISVQYLSLSEKQN